MPAAPARRAAAGQATLAFVSTAAEVDPGPLERLADAASREAVRTLLTRYAGRTPERLRRITAALDAGDVQAARREAHSLKGGARQFGAVAVGDIAARLEEALDAGRAEEARRCLPPLVEAQRRFAEWAAGWS